MDGHQWQHHSTKVAHGYALKLFPHKIFPTRICINSASWQRFLTNIPHRGYLFLLVHLGPKCHVVFMVTSQWAYWRLKSPVPRLFTLPFIQGQIKENIKAQCHWPFVWGIRWWCGKCFHLMLSSCYETYVKMMSVLFTPHCVQKLKHKFTSEVNLVMACHLFGLNHCMNQCWLIAIRIHKDKTSVNENIILY